MSSNEKTGSYSILTYGRLGPEFAEYINTLPGFSSRFVKKERLADVIGDYEYIAGLALPEDINLSHIKWIHAFSAGVDVWVSRNDLGPEVFITKTKGRMGIKMGEYCLAYMLYFIKSVHQTFQHQAMHLWKHDIQKNLFDQNVLVLSTGSIGTGIAQVLKPLVKKVTGVNSSGRSVEGFNDIISFDQLPKDLSEYDVVINALPLTKKSSGQINGSFFSRLRNSLYFNVGRGETTNEKDLLMALNNGNISKAVLDVFKTEPLPDNSKLWSHPNIIITPHQSAVTDIEDVKSSFMPAFEAFKNGLSNEYVVKRSKGY